MPWAIDLIAPIEWPGFAKLRGPKIQRSTRLRDYVGDRLAMGWSPEEIAGRRELDEMNDPVSAESIYRYVYSCATTIIVTDWRQLG